MRDTDTPTCGREQCDEDSEYLLTCGDRCREHAIEDQPRTVHYLDLLPGATV